MRLNLTRMMVGGWQQPAPDQIGDERQVGEKPLHERWPVRTQERGIFAGARRCNPRNPHNMSRTYYDEKSKIVLNREDLLD